MVEKVLESASDFFLLFAEAEGHLDLLAAGLKHIKLPTKRHLTIFLLTLIPLSTNHLSPQENQVPCLIHVKNLIQNLLILRDPLVLVVANRSQEPDQIDVFLVRLLVLRRSDQIEHIIDEIDGLHFLFDSN